jgi:uncharacterized protein YcbK (DUF882 family)
MQNDGLSRRGVLMGGLGAVFSMLATPAIATPTPAYKIRTLHLVNLHTDERFTANYWRNGRYDQGALAEVNHFLRDFRTGDTHRIEPKLLDLVYDVHRRLRANNRPFEIISGYRSPATNAMLHESTSGVASQSLHMEGRAIDLRLPGVKLSKIRDTAKALKGGGVGYYPASQFVHVDTGRVRYW